MDVPNDGVLRMGMGGALTNQFPFDSFARKRIDILGRTSASGVMRGK